MTTPIDPSMEANQKNQVFILTAEEVAEHGVALQQHLLDKMEAIADQYPGATAAELVAYAKEGLVEKPALESHKDVVYPQLPPFPGVNALPALSSISPAAEVDDTSTYESILDDEDDEDDEVTDYGYDDYEDDVITLPSFAPEHHVEEVVEDDDLDADDLDDLDGDEGDYEHSSEADLPQEEQPLAYEPVEVAEEPVEEVHENVEGDEYDSTAIEARNEDRLRRNRLLKLASRLDREGGN